MKILHLSDTHNCHHRLRDLPEADVVVHSGDFCMVGSEQEALDFLNWFVTCPTATKSLSVATMTIASMEQILTDSLTTCINSPTQELKLMVLSFMVFRCFWKIA